MVIEYDKKYEEYLKSVDCSDILLGFFGYNTEALKFYEKNGYDNYKGRFTRIYNGNR